METADSRGSTSLGGPSLQHPRNARKGFLWHGGPSRAGTSRTRRTRPGACRLHPSSACHVLVEVCILCVCGGAGRHRTTSVKAAYLLGCRTAIKVGCTKSKHPLAAPTPPRERLTALWQLCIHFRQLGAVENWGYGGEQNVRDRMNLPSLVQAGRCAGRGVCGDGSVEGEGREGERDSCILSRVCAIYSLYEKSLTRFSRAQARGPVSCGLQRQKHHHSPLAARSACVCVVGVRRALSKVPGRVCSPSPPLPTLAPPHLPSLPFWQTTLFRSCRTRRGC